ncbi:MAG: hypothetical protein M1170_00115 [Patescibacteria group bacterium]|nr:hypothetical protein [Patescibacteria group bacterium]
MKSTHPSISNVVLSKKLLRKIERWYGNIVEIEKDESFGDKNDILSRKVEPAWYCTITANRLCSKDEFGEIIDYALKNGAALKL